MKRRDLLKGGALAGLSAAVLPDLVAAPAPEASNWLAHLYLSGGPDFRHLMVPEYNSSPTSYGRVFWEHRMAAWGVERLADMEAIWNQMHWVEHKGQRFGFHPKAGWLAERWAQGHVAIVNNVIGSSTRNHELATCAMEVGDSTLAKNDRQLSGWGGRLAHAMGENIVSLTSRVRQFCYGPNIEDPLSHDNGLVISARNMRQFGLYRPDTLDERPDHTGRREVMSRALTQYYRAKRGQVPKESPYSVFLRHQQNLEEQGARIRSRLSSYEQSEELLGLLNGDSALHHRRFAQQCLNLVDAALCKDILSTSVASLEYEGWDTHRGQSESLDQRFSDLFSTTGGLATVHRALGQLVPDQLARCTWMIGGEFGRQLSANGDGGTDHGRGNTVLFIGNNVRGGLYGELFPESELERYEKPGRDILGQTSIEAVISKVCERMVGSPSHGVLTQGDSFAIEAGQSLDFLS